MVRVDPAHELSCWIAAICAVFRTANCRGQVVRLNH